uniref:Serpentine receptor class gamma n=1 Tax=Globodera rostochiensis TaxID=31243 RepID=A0A914GW10_GLORO
MQYAPVDDLFFNHIVMLCAFFSSISNRLHIIALAANRAHAMFFPFHYAQKMTKKFIFVQCVFMHLLSIPIAFYLSNFYTPGYYTWSYVIVPSLFYAAIVTKFAWIKAHNRSWNTEGAAASSSDKDSARITWTCFAIQSVTVCQLAYTSAINLQWFHNFMLCDPIGKMLFFPLQLALNLYYVADELFLLLLCKEMRKNCRQMLGKVWPFTTAQVAATDNDNGFRTSQTQNIKSVNVNFVGSNRRFAVQRSVQ